MDVRSAARHRRMVDDLELTPGVRGAVVPHVVVAGTHGAAAAEEYVVVGGCFPGPTGVDGAAVQPDQPARVGNLRGVRSQAGCPGDLTHLDPVRSSQLVG